MEMTYETRGKASLLSFCLGADDIIDSNCLNVITNNRIPGLLPAAFMQENGQSYIRYNVTNKIPMMNIMGSKRNRRQAMTLFLGLVNGVLAVEEYRLGQDSLVLNPRYIFIDDATTEPQLLCMPVNGGQGHMDMCTFFRNVYSSIQYDQSEDCSYATAIANYLSNEVGFTLPGFRQMLESLQGEAMQQTQMTQSGVMPPNPRPIMQQQGGPQPVIQQGGQMGAPVTGGKEISFLYLLQHYNKENAAAYKAQQAAKKAAKGRGQNRGQYVPPQPTPMPPQPTPMPPQPTPVPQNMVQPRPVDPVPQNRSANPGEITPMNRPAEGTTVLVSNPMLHQEKRGYLMRVKNQIWIEITKPIFHIGREPSYADFVISDNSAVSSKHADILRMNEGFYIVDTNSTNHTYINGKMILPNQSTLLQSGDRIRLADEDFEFRME